MCFGNNTPEIFGTQLVIIVGLDEKAHNGLTGFKIYLNIVFGKMAGIQKLTYLIVGHA